MIYSKRGWFDLLLLRVIYQPLINVAYKMMLPKLRRKYTESCGERRGEYDDEKLSKLGAGRPLWVHAVSVGEVQAAVPLIRAARDDGWTHPIILSTTTETGKVMANRLSKDVFDIHVYYPWDKKRFIKAALDCLKPSVFVAMETELWPNMLWELEERKIPAFLVNGRISDRTYKRLRGIGARIGRELFSLFTAFYLRSEEDKQRLTALGIAEGKIFVSGDVKIDALSARKRKGIAVELKALPMTGEAPILIAGSTHEGEEEVVISAYLMLKRERPDARLIIAPRHPDRAADIKAMLPPRIRFSMFSEVAEDWEILIIDKIGLLFDLYSLASAAFVGGSLIPKGGQNILEPAIWGVPIEHGPYMEDFIQPSREFIDLGMATVVDSPSGLADAWLKILRDSAGKEKQRSLSEVYFEKRIGASSRAWSGIKEHLEN